jgi:hypothetical protein
MWLTLTGLMLAGAPQTALATTFEKPGEATVGGTIALKLDSALNIGSQGGGAGAGKRAYKELKLNCSELKIVALDSSSKTVGQTTAVPGDGPGTCSYSMRVPANTALTITVGQAGANAVMVKTIDEAPKEAGAGGGAGKAATGGGGGPGAGALNGAAIDSYVKFTPTSGFEYGGRQTLGTLGPSGGAKATIKGESVSPMLPAVQKTVPLQIVIEG